MIKKVTVVMARTKILHCAVSLTIKHYFFLNYFLHANYLQCNNLNNFPTVLWLIFIEKYKNIFFPRFIKKKQFVRVVNFCASLMKNAYQKRGYVTDQQIVMIVLTKATAVRIINTIAYIYWYVVIISQSIFTNNIDFRNEISFRWINFISLPKNISRYTIIIIGYILFVKLS